MTKLNRSRLPDVLELQPGDLVPEGYVQVPRAPIRKGAIGDGAPWTPQLQRMFSAEVPIRLVECDHGCHGPLARFAMTNGRVQTIYVLAASDAGDPLFDRLTAEERSMLTLHASAAVRHG